MEIKTFHVSVVVPTSTMVIYGILFGDMQCIKHFKEILSLQNQRTF